MWQTTETPPFHWKRGDWIKPNFAAAPPWKEATFNSLVWDLWAVHLHNSGPSSRLRLSIIMLCWSTKCNKALFIHNYIQLPPTQWVVIETGNASMNDIYLCCDSRSDKKGVPRITFSHRFVCSALQRPFRFSFLLFRHRKKMKHCRFSRTCGFTPKCSAAANISCSIIY